MPEYRCRPIPQSFLAAREITRELTPLEFLHCYYHLKHIITTVESDLQDLMHFRGWRACGPSSGPECRMRKIFPSGAIGDLRQDRPGNRGNGLFRSPTSYRQGPSRAGWLRVYS